MTAKHTFLICNRVETFALTFSRNNSVKLLDHKNEGLKFIFPIWQVNKNKLLD